MKRGKLDDNIFIISEPQRAARTKFITSERLLRCMVLSDDMSRGTMFCFEKRMHGVIRELLIFNFMIMCPDRTTATKESTAYI